ncbi:MAG: hypothetical protein ACI857_001731 [Arenicella sp.]|jgi:hypothetical protein
MKAIETSIILKANTAKVWQELMNFDSYPEWNPFITKLSGEAIESKQIEAHIKLGSKKVQKFKPEVLTVSINKEFRWKGKLFFKGLFDGEHYFILEELEDNTCKFVHGERFSGLFSKLILSMIIDDTKAGFEKMNQALKELVESK